MAEVTFFSDQDALPYAKFTNYLYWNYRLTDLGVLDFCRSGCSVVRVIGLLWQTEDARMSGNRCEVSASLLTNIRVDCCPCPRYKYRVNYTTCNTPLSGRTEHDERHWQALCVRGMRRRPGRAPDTFLPNLFLYYTHIDTAYTEPAFFSFTLIFFHTSLEIRSKRSQDPRLQIPNSVLCKFLFLLRAFINPPQRLPPPPLLSTFPASGRSSSIVRL